MPPTAIISSPELAIEFSASNDYAERGFMFFPGDAITGQVVRQAHIVAP